MSALPETVCLSHLAFFAAGALFALLFVRGWRA